MENVDPSSSRMLRIPPIIPRHILNRLLLFCVECCCGWEKAALVAVASTEPKELLEDTLVQKW